MKLDLPELQFVFCGDNHLSRNIANHLNSVGVLVGLIPEPRQVLGDSRFSVMVEPSVTEDGYRLQYDLNGTVCGVRFSLRLDKITQSEELQSVNGLLYELWSEILDSCISNKYPIAHETLTTLDINLRNATAYLEYVKDETSNSRYWTIGKLVVDETLSLLHFKRGELSPVNFIRLWYGDTVTIPQKRHRNVTCLTLSLCGKVEYSPEYVTPDASIGPVDHLVKGVVKPNSVFELLCQLPETKLLFERGLVHEETQESIPKSD